MEALSAMRSMVGRDGAVLVVDERVGRTSQRRATRSSG